MAGTGTQDRTTTRQQRRRQAQQPASAADVEPRDGDAVVGGAEDQAPEVVEHTLVVGDADAPPPLSDEQLATRAAEMKANDGVETEHAVDLQLDPPIDPRFDADSETIFEEDLPEPPVTVVVLNLGRHGGRRRMRLQHRPGCPGRMERVESSPVRSPSGRKGVMTRCVDCAEQTYTRIT
jgi:hypothetical protein